MPEWSDHSRFRRQDTIIVDGVETMGRWKEPRWSLVRPDRSDISTFHVTNNYEGRPDRIADVIYGDPTMDWVLIAFNKVRNPLNWPKTGTVLEYPAGRIVFQEL